MSPEFDPPSEAKQFDSSYQEVAFVDDKHEAVNGEQALQTELEANVAAGQVDTHVPFDKFVPVEL